MTTNSIWHDYKIKEAWIPESSFGGEFFWRVAQTTLEHDTKNVFLLNQGTEIIVVKSKSS